LCSKTARGFEGALLVGREPGDPLDGIALGVDVGLEGFGSKTTGA
jgi:hypothetical protein